MMSFASGSLANSPRYLTKTRISEKKKCAMLKLELNRVLEKSDVLQRIFPNKKQFGEGKKNIT